MLSCKSCLTKILKCTSFGVNRDITISILNQNQTEAVLCADHCTSRHLKDNTASLPVACSCARSSRRQATDWYEGYSNNIVSESLWLDLKQGFTHKLNWSHCQRALIKTLGKTIGCCCCCGWTPESLFLVNINWTFQTQLCKKPSGYR